MSKFSVVPLTDMCDVLSGGTPKTSVPEYWDGEIPWASVKDFNTNSRWFSSTEKRISREGLDSCSSVLLEPGELVISARGTVGVISQPTMQTAFNQSNYGLRAKQGLADNDYLYYALVHANKALLGDTHGGMFDTITRSTLDRLLVPNPPLKEQRRIAEALGVFDEKIALNKELSKTLGNLAQSIFKSWFIDFDPVRARMAGEKPIGMDVKTASLFPESMDSNEGGEIPSGWREATVSDICDSVVNGSTPLRSKSEFWKEADFAWFKTGELSDNFLFESKESITHLALSQTSVKTLPKGSVLMAIYAAPTVGRLGILTKESTFNQACTGMTPRDDFGTAYLYLTLFNRRVWFNSLAIGAAQQNISKGVVENCPTIIAPTAVHEAFREVTDPIFSEMEQLARQNIYLERIRDSLLPKLVSGELDVPEEILES